MKFGCDQWICYLDRFFSNYGTQFSLHSLQYGISLFDELLGDIDLAELGFEFAQASFQGVAVFHRISVIFLAQAVLQLTQRHFELVNCCLGIGFYGA
jgi:hypothetical protein